MDVTRETHLDKEKLFHHTYLKALLDNKNNLAQWKAYKEKYEETIKNLKYYIEKSQHSVCIPVGKKAFVKGQLVHTNDVMVTLGSGWFLKTSSKKAVEICERRINGANELIEKWEKESKLLEAMRDYSMNKDTFGGEEGKEILEPFDEDKDKNWRHEHKLKERKYREQLKELKDKTSSVTLKDEKDIWEHLEMLELQEELQDELDRLGEDETSEDYDSDDISPNEEEDSSENNTIIKEQAHVSLYKSIEIVDDDSQNAEYEVLSTPNAEIPQYSKEKPKKAKKVTFKDEDDVHELKVKEIPPIPTQEAVLDMVVERDLTNDIVPENEQKRPVSKFKMKRKS